MMRQLLFPKYVIGGLLVQALIAFCCGAWAEESCFEIVPAKAKPVGDLRLCKSNHSGQLITYSCRDYLSKQGRYRLFYKGGTSPKAVAYIDQGYRQTHVQWVKETTGQELDCKIAPPQGVPKLAEHLGTGVCDDKNDQPVPCSIFRYAPVRNASIYHYMVFYDEHGGGPSEIVNEAVDTNSDALAAELIYQLGLALLNTSCCQKEAACYLAYAYELFPYAQDYRTAYQQQQIVLAASSQRISCPVIMR